MNPERSERIEIPVLPLRDVVVYPHMVIPLFVGREKSIRCLEAAMDHDKKIMLVAQKEASTDEPGVNDLFTVGTVASILQMLKLPDGTVKVLVEGLQRARISALSDNGEHFSAKAEYLDSPAIDEREQEVLVRTAISQFEGYIKLNKKIPYYVLLTILVFGLSIFGYQQWQQRTLHHYELTQSYLIINYLSGEREHIAYQDIPTCK